MTAKFILQRILLIFIYTFCINVTAQHLKKGIHPLILEGKKALLEENIDKLMERVVETTAVPGWFDGTSTFGKSATEAKYKEFFALYKVNDIIYKNSYYVEDGDILYCYSDPITTVTSKLDGKKNNFKSRLFIVFIKTNGDWVYSLDYVVPLPEKPVEIKKDNINKNSKTMGGPTSQDVEFMKTAIGLAHKHLDTRVGYPFGAIIVKDGVILAEAGSTINDPDRDPTSHAEINAIREASKKLKSPNLSGSVMYASGSPCPMCQSVIYMSGISKVYFASSQEDVNKYMKYGFTANDLSQELCKPISQRSIFQQINVEEANIPLIEWSSLTDQEKEKSGYPLHPSSKK